MSSEESAIGFAVFLLGWIVIGNLIGMVLVLLIKPKGKNRFGKAGVPRGPVEAISACLTSYASANGRSSRSEFWWFFLLCIIISIVLNILDVVLKTKLFSFGNYGLFLPMLTAQIRRLHDIRRTGWWVLLNVTGLPIVLYVLYAWPGTKDDAEKLAETF